MGKQREYRRKIKTVGALRKTFNAMELIASSKIGKAKQNATQFEPYASAVNDVVRIAAKHAENGLHHKIFTEYKDKKDVIVLCMTSDRSMAGSFNSNVIRTTERLMRELKAQGKVPTLYVMGAKGFQYFTFQGFTVSQEWLGRSDSPDHVLAGHVTGDLLGQFGDKYGEVYVVYTHFRNMLLQDVQTIKLLPIEIVSRDADTDVTDTGGSSVLAAAAGQVSGTTSEGPSDDEKLHALYEFIPNARAVLDLLLPYYVECRVYDFMSQSFASEMAARQNAMHTATDNATDLIKKYTLLANKARQEQITSEIIEIVSGADALS